MTIPTFVNLEHDVEQRKAYVTVQDREIQKQREMWGMFFTRPLHTTQTHKSNEQTQGPHAHISIITSSASPKVIPQFSAS